MKKKCCKSEWVFVGNRKPKPNTDILLSLYDGHTKKVSIGWYDGSAWRTNEPDRGFVVIAWQKLPEPR